MSASVAGKINNIEKLHMFVPGWLCIEQTVSTQLEKSLQPEIFFHLWLEKSLHPEIFFHFWNNAAIDSPGAVVERILVVLGLKGSWVRALIMAITFIS